MNKGLATRILTLTPTTSVGLEPFHLKIPETLHKAQISKTYVIKKVCQESISFGFLNQLAFTLFIPTNLKISQILFV